MRFVYAARSDRSITRLEIFEKKLTVPKQLKDKKLRQFVNQVQCELTESERKLKDLRRSQKNDDAIISTVKSFYPTQQCELTNIHLRLSICIGKTIAW